MAIELTLEEKLLANAIHGMQCKGNHTPGAIEECDFFADFGWKNPSPTKIEYIERAKALLQKYSHEQIKQIVQIMNGQSS